eukprot:TRINITY_DN3195_c0_g1_i1.p1 TRINITY_DN3195_c0_g1~~TRINITY_DN3195_c0_g1_i1.p1  ORF type:complete len:236 (+),score=38.97 TRINITY_DN3195_c0_g1_i1:46-708(+)
MFSVVAHSARRRCFPAARTLQRFSTYFEDPFLDEVVPVSEPPPNLPKAGRKSKTSKGSGDKKTPVSDSSTPGFGLYRPNTNPSVGSAMQFSYNPVSKSVYIQLAKQKGPKLPPGVSGNQFDWENKLVTKISISESGKILALFKGRLEAVDLIHRFPSAQLPTQTTIKILKGKKEGTWALQVMKDHAGTKKSIAFFFTTAESRLIQVFLEEAICRGVGFRE